MPAIYTIALSLNSNRSADILPTKDSTLPLSHPWMCLLAGKTRVSHSIRLTRCRGFLWVLLFSLSLDRCVQGKVPHLTSDLSASQDLRDRTDIANFDMRQSVICLSELCQVAPVSGALSPSHPFRKYHLR